MAIAAASPSARKSAAKVEKTANEIAGVEGSTHPASLAAIDANDVTGGVYAAAESPRQTRQGRKFPGECGPERRQGAASRRPTAHASMW